MIVIRDWKTFYFGFDWTKGVDKNLKHEVEYIIKSNEALPDVLILCQIFKTILSTSLKSMKHQQQFMIFMFTLIELIIE